MGEAEVQVRVIGHIGSGMTRGDASTRFDCYYFSAETSQNMSRELAGSIAKIDNSDVL